MDKFKSKKSLSIFMINYDWRDMFRTSAAEFKDKLERDELNPDRNEFFFFSWSKFSYVIDEGRLRTVHKKTNIYFLKPILDLWTLILVQFTVRRFKLKPDVWMAYDFGMLPALWLARKLFGGKVVMCINNQPRIYSKTRRFGSIKSFYSWLTEKIWWRLADHYFTINENMKSYLMKIGIALKDITVFAMNTIERDSKYIGQAQKNLIRARYSIPPQKKILLTVARLEAEKNYPLLLELFAGLGDGYVLLALGRGSLLDPLLIQAKRLGIENRVIFPGFIHREDIWNFYADADLFVLISKVEALGVVFWEAMHVGVPVIGSIADGIVETIGNDGERGRIWKESDGQEGFNERVDFCLMPSPERDAMLVRAKEYVALQIRNKLTINDLEIYE